MQRGNTHRNTGERTDTKQSLRTLTQAYITSHNASDVSRSVMERLGLELEDNTFLSSHTTCSIWMLLTTHFFQVKSTVDKCQGSPVDKHCVTMMWHALEADTCGECWKKFSWEIRARVDYQWSDKPRCVPVRRSTKDWWSGLRLIPASRTKKDAGLRVDQYGVYCVIPCNTLRKCNFSTAFRNCLLLGIRF